MADHDCMGAANVQLKRLHPLLILFLLELLFDFIGLLNLVIDLLEFISKFSLGVTVLPVESLGVVDALLHAIIQILK